MRKINKSSQLQIRVTDEEKSYIERAAKGAGLSMSAWIMAKLLPPQELKFEHLLDALCADDHNKFAYAELNELLISLSPSAFLDICGNEPTRRLSPYALNYLAAMIELAAVQNGVPPPKWTARIPPLSMPYFGAPLMSLRLYLLTHSPAAFRRRNIFIDATLGDRL